MQSFYRYCKSVIDQGEAPEFYFQKYPEENPVLGFFTWRWVLSSHPRTRPHVLISHLSWDVGSSRWSFLKSADAIRKQEFSDILPRASVKDLGVVLMGAGYEVELLLQLGVSEDQSLFHRASILGPTGFLSTPTEAFNTEVHVNSIYMDYYDSGEVSQFHTDLSLLDLNGKKVMRKTRGVNDRLRYGGITIYQTDWSFSALQILKDDEGPFSLAVAPPTINGDKKLFGTFLPIGNTDSPDIKGISMLAHDLQSIIRYDQQGKFAGVRRSKSKLH
ncbi:hypothetical protein PTKIN_Ptkin10aG0117600 [Pterospermum kingtungense]